MSRLIDADALMPELKAKRNYLDTSSPVDRGKYIAINKAITMLDEQPTVDAVEVVRCGGCKWWKCADDTEIIKYGDCTHPYSAVRKNCLPNETWFCADGERRDDGDNH